MIQRPHSLDWTIVSSSMSLRLISDFSGAATNQLNTINSLMVDAQIKTSARPLDSLKIFVENSTRKNLFNKREEILFLGFSSFRQTLNDLSSIIFLSLAKFCCWQYTCKSSLLWFSVFSENLKANKLIFCQKRSVVLRKRFPRRHGVDCNLLDQENANTERDRLSNKPSVRNNLFY